MLGLFLIFCIAVWLFLAYGLIRFVTSKVPPKPWRVPLRAGLYVALLPLPVLDEIVGAVQFNRICQENSTITVDRTKAAGRTVYRRRLPNIAVEGTWIPMVITPWRFHDVTTQELVVSYNTVDAFGGRLIYVFPLWEGRKPLILSKSYCQPDGLNSPNELLKELGMHRIEASAEEVQGVK